MTKAPSSCGNTGAKLSSQHSKKNFLRETKLNRIRNQEQILSKKLKLSSVKMGVRRQKCLRSLRSKRIGNPSELGVDIAGLFLTSPGVLIAFTLSPVAQTQQFAYGTSMSIVSTLNSLLTLFYFQLLSRSFKLKLMD
jgi:hypothetical protein